MKKIRGHSLELLERHYDRSDVWKRNSKAKQRSIGNRKNSKLYVDLKNLDDWSDDAITGKISVASIALKIKSLKKCKSIQLYMFINLLILWPQSYNYLIKSIYCQN